MVQDYHPLEHDDEGWCQDTDYHLAPWLIPPHNNSLIAADTTLYPIQPLPYRPMIFDTASIAITDAQILQMNCISDGPLPSKENGVILEIMEEIIYENYNWRANIDRIEMSPNQVCWIPESYTT